MTKNIDKVLLLSLFAGYTCKVAVLGASASDAAVVLVLAAAHFLYTWKIENKEITELKNQIEVLKLADVKLLNEINEAKTAAASLKIAAGLRPAK